jgi:hypothetical protein
MEQSWKSACNRATLLALCCGLSAGPMWAATPKERKSALDLKEFFIPELYVSNANLALEAALPQLANRANWESFLAQRGEDPANPRTRAFVDGRSGAVVNLLEAVPLVPGRGEGNRRTG